MGEQLNGLSVNELNSLENQIEISLRGIRMRKVHKYIYSTLYYMLWSVLLKRLTIEHNGNQ